jgi:hypothetical protein
MRPTAKVDGEFGDRSLESEVRALRSKQVRQMLAQAEGGFAVLPPPAGSDVRRCPQMSCSRRNAD